MTILGYDANDCRKCGSDDLNLWHSHRCQAYFVICQSCGHEDGRERTEAQAVAVWNGNVPDGQADLVQRLRKLASGYVAPNDGVGRNTYADAAAEIERLTRLSTPAPSQPAVGALLPYAFCCNGDPKVCDCVNPNHGTAIYKAVCIMPNCRNRAQADKAFCHRHRDRRSIP